MRSTLFAFLLLASSFALAQESGVSGFDLSQLDRTADPCNDFYQFACGGWRAKNPIPPDKSRWGRYDEMQEKNRAALKTLLEKASSEPKNTPEKQVGDFYAACMDESTVNKASAAPLAPYFKKINGIKNGKQLISVIADLHNSGIPALFEFGSNPDLKNATQVIAGFDQGGIGLPDRDYYLKADAKSVERREKYEQHVANMLRLAGESPEQAKENAKVVMQIETELAKAQMDRTARRDPKNLDHAMKRSELPGLGENFYFETYLAAAKPPKFTALNVANPDFFKQVNGTLKTHPLDHLKTYLRWHVTRRLAPRLSDAFVNENFEFNQKYLRGAKELEARWKRCVREVDESLGESTGKMYVDAYFGAEGKERFKRLVMDVMEQLKKSIQEADWMSEPTRKQALTKLAAISTAKLGFPEKYRDYSSVNIKRDDYAGNFVRAHAFEARRQLNKIGKPVDKSEWGMTTPTVNAYYDPQFAEIVFPAGILQAPMFNREGDDAYNYGAIGRVVGHELTHGFDDSGRQFDAQGNLKDWWTEADAKAFESKASCFVDQYAEYESVPAKDGQPAAKLNGKLTLGENTADNGGLRMTYYAYEKSLEGKERKIVDGFTPEQRVFLGYAVSRCENVTEQAARLLAVVDPHSPGKFRLIGAISNMPEFAEAFKCKAGDKMVRGNKSCRVW
jgi:endothelin-converting enzyme/putative endopeptidase